MIRPHDPGNRPAPPPLDELVEGDVPPEELAAIRQADALLRQVPPPPEAPHALARDVERLARPRGTAWSARRKLGALALAAALSALFFALGTRVGGGEAFDAQATIRLQATDELESGSALIRLGELDAAGNRILRLEAEGLPDLPDGGYYVLWLARDGEYAATCGSFSVGSGETEAEWTVSYDLDAFDAWVVTARVPGDEGRDGAPWLLTADVDL